MPQAILEYLNLVPNVLDLSRDPIATCGVSRYRVTILSEKTPTNAGIAAKASRHSVSPFIAQYVRL